jgi:hypothetical protein
MIRADFIPAFSWDRPVMPGWDWAIMPVTDIAFENSTSGTPGLSNCARDQSLTQSQILDFMHYVGKGLSYAQNSRPIQPQNRRQVEYENCLA